ncbi:MAG: endopeptidase La, partial [Alphaproteobacteria bacterium]
MDSSLPSGFGAEGRRSLLPLVPLRDLVIFPYMVVPLFVGRARSIAALEEAMAKDKRILLAAQMDAKQQEPGEDEIYRVGTIGHIVQLLRLPDQTVKVLVEGKTRARIREFLPSHEYHLVYAEEVQEEDEFSIETEALVRSMHQTFATYVKLDKRIPQDIASTINAIEEPGRLADALVAHLKMKLEHRQEILETFHAGERLEKLYNTVREEIEILQVERRIKSRVKKQVEHSRKEQYLNEQMRAIQKELGERDEFKAEIQELEERIKKKKMSKEATEKVKAEFKKLRMMSPLSAEAAVVRNYIDTLLALPWFEKTEDNYDIDEAEKILEEDHYGLQKVKERILEYLAVQKLVEKLKGPILCLVGPPGVGKTSVGKSIARASKRKFLRMSLGGVRDEAEIRGHRRTYIGSMPGKIMQQLKKAGTNNPVFLLDEVDKMSSDFRGDPTSALLEVLDPEQNHTFNDHYLDVDYDLSDVMFVATANTMHNVPAALQDRMEIIYLHGYTEDDKMAIAKGFLVPKQKEAHGLADKDVSFADKGLLTITRLYTREAGVRNLEREIASICRKVARRLAKTGHRDDRVRVTEKSIPKYLGVPRYRVEQIEQLDLIGLANGLAWTQAGGELLATEVAVMPGKGKLSITGQLGDVMQESAQAALAYVRNRGPALGLPEDFYNKIDIHVHIPEGAIPKDGPSAGITICTAIVSALLKIPVRRDVAMTG